ncbi:pyridoxamine 5'-phosphate oxidase family protein [Spirosoma spitsbergense]|uniref:pyridoxamine 5'-phosphate oxidase family protein n=1 Tax=Spirosoma spitsbergense TaxID=431554 RepID=UPI000371119F|nr:pyridoxamine 5'-phosphate oxidase family protein [Spirosoma spitsbergense]
MQNYATLAFTDPVRKLQERFGSRSAYARQENYSFLDGLTDQEIRFIAERDSFYMASIGENGFPYIQHRGGPKGFVKVIDNDHIGFVDFVGNRQYISVGNILTHPKVSLIMVDYPRRARLKFYAEAAIVELIDQSDLFDLLDPADYPHRPERMMVLTVQAYDWNCPQHITPRYTAEDIAAAMLDRDEYVRSLETELARYRQKATESL